MNNYFLMTQQELFFRMHCSGLMSTTNTISDILHRELESIVYNTEHCLGETTPLPEDLHDIRVSTRKICCYLGTV